MQYLNRALISYELWMPWHRNSCWPVYYKNTRSLHTQINFFLLLTISNKNVIMRLWNDAQTAKAFIEVTLWLQNKKETISITLLSNMKKYFLNMIINLSIRLTEIKRFFTYFDKLHYLHFQLRKLSGMSKKVFFVVKMYI